MSTFSLNQDITDALQNLEHPDTNLWEPNIKDFMSTETDKEKKKMESEMLKLKFNKKYDTYEKRLVAYNENKRKAYGVFWARCSSQMKAQIESREDFETKIEKDPVELIKAIKQHALNYKEHRYEMSIISDAMKTWLLSKQKEGEHLNDYTKRYRTAVEVFESHLGGPIILQNYVKGMEGYPTPSNDSNDAFADAVADESDQDEQVKQEESQKDTKSESQKEVKKLIAKAFEQLVAYVYMDNADKKKYGQLLDALSQQQSLKVNQYPKTLADANQVLANHRHDNFKEKKEESKKQASQGNDSGKSQNQNQNQSPLELSFAQLIKGNCYCCGKKGHYLDKCPIKDSTPQDKWVINVAKKKDAAFHQVQNQNDDNGTIASVPNPPSTVSAPATGYVKWNGAQLQKIKGVQFLLAENVDMTQVILADNQSTSTIFCNKDYVCDIGPSKDPLDLETNGGVFTTQTEATVPGFWKRVWFDERAITNIFAMHELAQQYRITFDSSKENAFIVHSDPPIKFQKAPNGLYYYIPSKAFVNQVQE